MLSRILLHAIISLSIEIEVTSMKIYEGIILTCNAEILSMMVLLQGEPSRKLFQNPVSQALKGMTINKVRL